MPKHFAWSDFKKDVRVYFRDHPDADHEPKELGIIAGYTWDSDYFEVKWDDGKENGPYHYGSLGIVS